MSATFPNSPTTGQITTTNGLRFIYDGTAWRQYSSTTNEMRASSVNSGSLSAFRNVIMNGGFELWERGTPITPSTGLAFADRWRSDFDVAGTRTAQAITDLTAANFIPEMLQNRLTSFMRYAITVAPVGATSNVIQQRVENIYTLQGGPVVLSFYARAASSITLTGISLAHNYGTGGSPSSQVVYTLASSLTVDATWRRYWFTTILPRPTGTLGSNGDDNLGVRWFLPTNTTLTFDMTGVQLERGTFPTPYEHRSVNVELAMCKRYSHRTTIHVQSPSGSGASHATGFYFPQPMRTTPSRFNVSGGSTGGSFAIVTETSTTPYGGRYEITPTTAGAFNIDRQHYFFCEL